MAPVAWGHELPSSNANIAGSEAPLPVNSVVELFTSQGCAACPPADALLGELASRAGVLALSFHVSYWDYIGWRDPFASQDNNSRQRAYATAMAHRYLYTPQMVINGHHDVKGTEREHVLQLVDDPQQIIPLSVRPSDGGGWVVSLPAAPKPRDAAVWLIQYDGEHATQIGRGESSGRLARDYNVVRDIHRIGWWTGAAEEMHIPPSELNAGERASILVQGQDMDVLAAATLPVVKRAAGSGNP